MRQLATLLLLMGALGLLAAPALAGPPLVGTYQSTDLGGVIHTGRYTEAWDAGGGALLTNTTQNCGSWDGAALGTEWLYTCGTATGPATLIFNGVNALGNGNRTYACYFTGGVFWLSGTGPWANGDPDYPGHFDSYVEYETITYVNWIPVAAVTNVQNSAHFDNYPETCISFSIANGTRVGTTDDGDVKPADYPAYLDPSCGATRTLGAWWNMTALTISILGDCTVSAKPSTWGSLKAMYR